MHLKCRLTKRTRVVVVVTLILLLLVILYVCFYVSIKHLVARFQSVLGSGHGLPMRFEKAITQSFRLKKDPHDGLCETLKQLPAVRMDSENEKMDLSEAQANHGNINPVVEKVFKHCNINTYNIDPRENTLLNCNHQTIFAITPTHKRLSQKVDLTSLCQTLMNVPDLVWIVVEDSKERSDLVTALLKRCNKVKSVHLNSHRLLDGAWPQSRGIPARNYGLLWIRSYCAIMRRSCPCRGVVYFMDDDNKYDLRLFEEMRKTKRVSLFPVAFAGGLKFEGPICHDEKIVDWRVAYLPKRFTPIDMAGFTINIKAILEMSKAWMGYNCDNKTAIELGEVESRFLEYFIQDESQFECRGSDSEVYVWHVRVGKPDLNEEKRLEFRGKDISLEY